MNEAEPIPRQSLPPEKLSRFVASPIHREALRGILRNPSFIAAINLLCEQSRVNSSDLSRFTEQGLIRRAAYFAGVSEVYERLEALVQAPAEELNHEAWDHLQPEI